ncbi:unnamed protein product [Rhizophagus irregularis]|nr:unnamed protein product [Rhizophagus irregularis]
MRAPSYLKQRSRYRQPIHWIHANNLNRTWHRFKTALLTAARSAFSKQVISLNKTKKTPVELQPYQHISHKLDHYIRSLSRHFTISELYTIAERNANFYEDKGKFIRSSLNREKRSIVLDRVLVTDIPGSPQLLIAPDDIHAAAIKHFQNIIGPSRSPFKSLNELPERWKNRYTPLSEINPDIYQLVMAPVDTSELRAVINNSPSRKAPGPPLFHMNGSSFYQLMDFLFVSINEFVLSFS